MTEVLNIDEMLKKEPAITVVIGGVEHHCKEPTLEDFLENLKDIKALAAAPDVIAETEATMRMICRAFPTLTPDSVRQWPTASVERLFDMIRNIDNTSVTETDAQGNGQAAS